MRLSNQQKLDLTHDIRAHWDAGVSESDAIQRLWEKWPRLSFSQLSAGVAFQFQYLDRNLGNPEFQGEQRRSFVIGDVEPRVQWPRGDYKIETDWGDPLALDYVVGDGPREPVWREKAPLWAPIDRKARDAHYAGYGVVGMRLPPVVIDPRFP